MFWPSIAISAKRFHDSDMSGWWVLLNFVPGGTLIVFIMNGFFRGSGGANRFGALTS
jgi:uncharacterized membrane protein YhaH (DUF805 family)